MIKGSNIYRHAKNKKSILNINDNQKRRSYCIACSDVTSFIPPIKKHRDFISVHEDLTIVKVRDEIIMKKE